MSHKHQIVIIGGGNAGISVASKLLLKDKSLDIAIIDPFTIWFSHCLISIYIYISRSK